MNTAEKQTPQLYMAPLKGITDALFRQVFTAHFPGLDRAVAPFINPQKSPRYPDKLIADLMPAYNGAMPLVPQILNNDVDGFVALGNRLFDLGYSEINWNLGCPVKMVAGKRRGSGLLPYPDAITHILDRVVPKLKPKLSIKMRLGYEDHRESLVLLPRLEHYPLASITIHARLGVQLYGGSVNLDHFDQCRALTTHRLIYNGDLVSRDTFLEFAGRFAAIDGWMIGRGLLMNPFLPAEIKGYSYSGHDRIEKLQLFHAALFAALKSKLSGPGHLLGRMKQVWIYFGSAFPGQEKRVKKVIRSTTEKTYLQAVEKIFSAQTHYLNTLE